MIVSKTIKTGINGRNLYYYEGLGYTIPRYKDSRGRSVVKKGTKIEVKIEDLHCGTKIRVLCECEDCGIKRWVQYDTLTNRNNSSYNKTGETICSDCANKRMSGKDSGQYKHGCSRFAEYRNNAKRRNIGFEITVEQFKELTSKSCHYCGGHSSDRNKKSRGNGIDRKDSDIGYIFGNCVPCCATCNFVKNSMPYKEFIQYVRNLYHRTRCYEI